MAVKLPKTVTPEQFKRAEPIVLQAIIEEYYTDGIRNLRTRDYRAIAPGRYTGEFRDKDDPKRRFTFELDGKSIKYKPVDPNAIKDRD